MSKRHSLAYSWNILSWCILLPREWNKT